MRVLVSYHSVSVRFMFHLSVLISNCLSVSLSEPLSVCPSLFVHQNIVIFSIISRNCSENNIFMADRTDLIYVSVCLSVCANLCLFLNVSVCLSMIIIAVAYSIALLCTTDFTTMTQFQSFFSQYSTLSTQATPTSARTSKVYFLCRVRSSVGLCMF